MKTYLVGGAVRDQLMGMPVKERDYVVVGASVEEMIQLKFLPVGKDFPVFLHPETKEEYALARTERKIGKGYKGFVFNASADVTLEEDLRRRDLTINAMAKEGEQIIDPYGGQDDIKKKILRHVSPAFSEDPVRILRVARFASRFADFTIAKETMELMKQMVKLGEVDALVAERVWKECERALIEDHPEKFFEVLADCEALSVLFPYPLDIEILKKSSNQASDPQIRFAALCHSLSENEIRILCERYRIPSEYRDLAMLVVRYQDDFLRMMTLDAEKILNLLQSIDAFRREDRFEKFLKICEVCFSQANNIDKLRKCFQLAKTVDAKSFAESNLKGNEIGERIRQARIKKINEV